jgi:hypothetical protein
MPLSSPLDYLPIWALLVCISAAVLAFIEIGFQYGRYRCAVCEVEATAPLATILSATLGLLAFMLAFTFGLAASRFEARRQTVVEEANSIGTTYLRASFLPQPQATQVRQLLSQYVDSRLDVATTGNADQALRRADELHLQLWRKAEEVGQSNSSSIVVGLFIESLNETIDIHSKRVLVGLRSRLPLALWLALFVLTAFSMIGVGYHEALAKSKRSPARLLLIFGFLAVLTLIVDLDRPFEGFLTVNQEAMINLKSMMEKLP